MPMPMKIQNLERAFEVEFVVPGDQEALRFKVEVYSLRYDSNEKMCFSARVFRYDFFLLHAISLNQGDPFSDHDLLVLDPIFGLMSIEASSVDEASDEVMKKICNQLGTD